MADVASGSVLLTPKFDNLTSSIADQLDGAFSGASKIGGKAGSDAGGKFSSGLSAKAGAVMGLVSSVTGKAFDAISNSLGSAIGRVDTMNNFPKVMKNLGYSGQEAEASIKKMSASIDGLPTSLPGLTSMVQQLAPLCGSLDEATNIGIAFNDMCLASGASTADVSRAMQQYSQILSKGKPELQDWKTLQEVMPGQLNQVAKALIGPTANSKDLYNALKDGSITMGDFNNAVMKLDTEGVDGFASFAQQAKDSTQGIGTALDNISNRVAKAVQTIINAFGAENISGAINTFSGSFGKTADAIATVIYGIKDVVSKGVSGIASVFGQIKSALPSGFLDGIVGAFEKLAPAIAPAVTAFTLLLPVMNGMQKVFGIVSGFKSLGAALSAVAGGPVGLIIAAIAAVVVGLAALYNTNEDVRNAINSAWSGIQAAAAQVWPYIQQAVTTACSVIQGAVTQYWPVIQQVVTQVMGAVKDFVVSAWPTIQAAFTTACSVIQSIIQAVWPVIQTVITTVMQVINAVIGTVLAAINGDWSGVWTGIQSIIETVWTGIQSIVSAAIGAVSSIISSVLSTISGVWSGTWGAIKWAFSSIWNGIRGAATSGIDSVYTTVTGIKDKIVGFFSGAGSWLVESGKSILNGLKSGIESAIGSVTSSVEGAVETIRGLFPFSPAKWGPFSGHGYTTYSGKALMGDFGKSIVGAASSTAAMAERAMGTVNDALVAQPVDFSASSRGVSGIKSAAARVAMDVSASRDESAAAVIGWLGNNLPAIISECTPVMGESDFGRKVRKAVAYA